MSPFVDYFRAKEQVYTRREPSDACRVGPANDVEAV